LRATARQFPNRPVAVLVDDRPQFMSRISSPVPDGNEFLIASDLDADSANDLAVVLRSGLLAVPLRVVEARYLR
jgi:preprotein translocase subunit SecD